MAEIQGEFELEFENERNAAEIQKAQQAASNQYIQKTEQQANMPAPNMPEPIGPAPNMPAPDVSSPNIDIVNDIATTGSGRVKKQEAGQPYLDVNRPLEQSLLTQPEDYHEVVPGLMGTGVQTFTDVSGEKRPVAEYDPDTAAYINRGIYDPITLEDTETSHVEGQDVLPYNVQDVQRLAKENNLLKQPKEEAESDIVEEALQGQNTANSGSVMDQAKTFGIVEPYRFLEEQTKNAEPMRNEQKEIDYKDLKNDLNESIYHHTVHTLLDENLDENQAHKEAQRLVNEPKDIKKTSDVNLETKYGISNKAKDVRNSLLDIVSDNKSTLFSPEIRNLAKKYRDLFPGHALEYLPTSGTINNPNSVLTRGTFFRDLMKANKNNDLKTADDILNQVAQNVYTTANGINDEAVRQAALYKTKKSDYIPPISRSIFNDIPSGRTVADSIAHQIKEAGFSTKNIARPDKTKQTVGNLPIIFNETDSYIPSDYMKSLIHEQRVKGNLLAKGDYEKFKSTVTPAKLRKVKESLIAIVETLNGLYADLPITQKKLDIKPVQHELHDMIHNIHTGNQSTATISNILYDRNAKYTGDTDIKKDIYKNKDFRKLSDSQKSDYLKEILMPGVATPEKAEKLADLAHKYSPSADSDTEVPRAIMAMQKTNLWHPSFAEDLDNLLRPRESIYDKNGKIKNDSSTVVHLKIGNYDNEVNELKNGILATGIMKYGTPELQELGLKFFKTGDPLTDTMARLVRQKPEMKEVINSIANDKEMMQDIKEVQELTEKAAPATKSTSRLGINGTNTNHVIDLADAFSGNVNPKNLFEQYKDADLFSYVIDKPVEVRASFGVRKGEPISKYIDYVKKTAPTNWSELLLGAAIHSEFARANQIYSPESYSGISMTGAMSGYDAAKNAGVSLPPDIRLPAAVMEHIGAYYRQHKTYDTPVSVTMIHLPEIASDFRNPAYRGINTRILNNSQYTTDLGYQDITHIGGPLNELTGRNDIYGVAPPYNTRMVGEFNLLDKPMFEDFMPNINERRIPFGMFLKNTLKNPQQLQKYYDLIQNKYKPFGMEQEPNPYNPDPTDDRARIIYPTDYNIAHEPLKFTSIPMTPNEDPIGSYSAPIVFLPKNRQRFDTGQALKDVVLDLAQENARSSANNDLRGYILYDKIKDLGITDPTEINKKLIALTPKAAETVNLLENFQKKVAEPKLGLNLDSTDHETFSSVMDKAKEAIGKNPITRNLISSFGLEDEQSLHELGFTNPEYFISEETNNPESLQKKLREVSLEKYIPYTFKYNTATYKGAQKVKINSSVRGLLVIGRNLKPNQLGAGYELAKEIYKAPLKTYMKTLDVEGQKNFRAALKEPYNEGVYELLRNFSKGIPVVGFRLPKIVSTHNQFEVEVYKPDVDESGNYLANKNETKHIAIPIELAHQWNADTDGDMFNAASSAFNAKTIKRYAPENPIVPGNLGDLEAVANDKEKITTPITKPATISNQLEASIKNPTAFQKKDIAKSYGANYYIGDGAPGSSTDLYAKSLPPELVNPKHLTAADTVFLSVNGNRAGSKPFNSALLKPAIEAGAKIITDDEANASRKYNSGERAAATYLSSVGYIPENKPGGGRIWSPPGGTAVEGSTSESVSKRPIGFYPTVQNFKNLTTLAEKTMRGDRNPDPIKQQINEFIDKNSQSNVQLVHNPDGAVGVKVRAIDFPHLDAQQRNALFKVPIGERLEYKLNDIFATDYFYKKRLPQLINEDKNYAGKTVDEIAKMDFKPIATAGKLKNAGIFDVNPLYKNVEKIISHMFGEKVSADDMLEAKTKLKLTDERIDAFKKQAFKEAATEISGKYKGNRLTDFKLRKQTARKKAIDILRDRLYAGADKIYVPEINKHGYDVSLSDINDVFTRLKDDPTINTNFGSRFLGLGVNMNTGEPNKPQTSYTMNDKDLRSIAAAYLKEPEKARPVIHIPADKEMLLTLATMIQKNGGSPKFKIVDNVPDIPFKKRPNMEAPDDFVKEQFKQWRAEKYGSSYEDDDEEMDDKTLAQRLNDLHTIARINRRITPTWNPETQTGTPGISHLHAGSYGTQAKNILDAVSFGNLKLNEPSKIHIPATKKNQGVAYPRMTEI